MANLVTPGAASRAFGPLHGSRHRNLQAAARGDQLILLVIPVYIATFGYFFLPNGYRFPVVILSTLAFALVPMACPSFRPVRITPLCPQNWTIALFFLQLVVLPLQINLLGLTRGRLPLLPSDHSINVAILLSVLAYTSFGVTWQLLSRRCGSRQGQSTPEREEAIWRVPGSMILLYVVLGLIGFFLAFGSPANLLRYYSHPAADTLTATTGSASLSEALATFLRPFLGFAFVLIWCNRADLRQSLKPGLMSAVVAVTLVLGILVSYASFNYNRGAYVAPLIALLAVRSVRVGRLSFAKLTLIAAVVLPLLLVWQVYRTSTVGGFGDLLSNTENQAAVSRQLNVNQTIQTYGAAPQYTAFILDYTDDALHPYWGRTLLSSALYPLPVLGKSFRPASGVVLFNQAIYGPLSSTVDQIIPFQAELFINFHLFGVVLGYVVLALLLFSIQRAFEQASSATELFIWQYTAVWLAFLISGGLQPVSQIFIYFFWPIYIYFGAKAVLGRGQPRSLRPAPSPRRRR